MEMNIDLDGQSILCHIEIKNVKNINIRVKNNGNIYVSTPKAIDTKYIVEIILRHKEKILKSINKIGSNRLLQEFSYNDGEFIYMLNKKYVVNFLKSIKKGYYAVGNDCIDIYLCNCESIESRKRAYEKFITEYSTEIFNSILGDIYCKFSVLGIRYPEIKVRNMTSCWGICRPKKNIITLNKKLLEYQRNLIEYVICHEMIHFLEANHSKKFYDKLELVLPDYKARKKELKHIMYKNNL